MCVTDVTLPSCPEPITGLQLLVQDYLKGMDNLFIKTKIFAVYVANYYL